MTEQQADTWEAAQLSGVLIKNMLPSSRNPEAKLEIKTKPSLGLTA